MILVSRSGLTDPEIDAIREHIERVDAALVDLIARRVALARAAGERKRERGLPTLDAKREAAVVRRTARLARDAGLPPEDIRAVFWQLIGLCRRSQVESR